MAGTPVKTRATAVAGSDVRAAIVGVNALIDDVATVRAPAEEVVVAVTELMADHATFKTEADATETLVEELGDDHATFKTVVDEIKTTYNTAVTAVIELNADDNNVCNQVDYLLTPDGVVGGSYVLGPVASAATLACSGWIKYRISGIEYTAAMPATVTLSAQTITQSNFGAWRVEIDRLGAVTATSGATAAGYASAQIALLALGGTAPVANACTIGYFTATDSDSTYVVGTNNLDASGMTVVFYYERGPRKRISGLNTAQGAVSTLTASSNTYGVGNTNANMNGLKKAQINAAAAQALTDADTIATLKFGNVILMTNLVGTGFVTLNGAGTPGVTAMSYASAGAALTASDLVIDRLPAMFVPVALIKVNNQSVSTFTFKTTNWDATSITSTITDAAVAGWDRTVSTGFNSHQLSRVAIPALLTAPNPAAVSNSAPATLSASHAIPSAPATLSASVPSGTAIDATSDLVAAKIANENGTVFS